MEINRSLIHSFARKLGILCFCLFASSFAFGAASSSSAESFVHGLISYKNGDWEDARAYLRQSVASEEYSTDSNWYMIIMSEVYSSCYDDAINDCDYFIDNYPESNLLPAVEYQRGRAYHSVGLNDNAVMALSSFCNEHPDSDMYSSALFWIAECFYDDYDFETSRALYERIVAEFPDSPKKEDAEFKIYLITQHDREQKLLYLLKMTGEEYLNSRENFEKQLRMMQTDDMAELRKQLRDANARIAELENRSVPVQSGNFVTEESPAVITSGEFQKVTETAAKADEEILSLKAKASLIQRLLNEKKGEGK